jgi:hypothetical protein
VDVSPAERVAQVAIELCQLDTADPVVVAEAHQRLAREAGGRRSVLLDAFVLCVMCSSGGEATADCAARLLDDVQSSDLVA